MKRIHTVVNTVVTDRTRGGKNGIEDVVAGAGVCGGWSFVLDSRRVRPSGAAGVIRRGGNAGCYVRVFLMSE